ncbi:MAG: hypothetical protein R3F49_10645 [Planctomycetota bacterium]
MRNQQLSLLAVAGALTAASASAQVVLINDNFETDTSADYSILGLNTPLDGTQTFAFDYVAAGVPLAPRSSVGDVGGLKLTCNDTVGAVDSVSCIHNTFVSAPHYRLTVDVWMNFVGATGTTEHGHIGVGSNGLVHNQYSSPTSGSGSFLAFTGDGGSASDYRWYRDLANLPPNELDSGLMPTTDPSYLGHGGNASDPFYQGLFPSPPATIAGSPGNIWTTVTIDVDATTGFIDYSFDGTLVFHGTFAGSLDGQITLGLADIFSSFSGPTNFTLYDNLVVETITGGLGAHYCTAVANSTGSAATINATGSEVAADNDVTLEASALPLNAFGFFLTSLTQGNVGQPGGSQGVLCLSGSIGRYVGAGQIQNSGTAGAFALALDLTQTPTPTGLVTVTAGQTWNFQAWYRDSIGGVATSNFTDGLAIDFQ